MIKRKSVLATLFLTFIMGFTYSFNTFFQAKEFITHAKEDKNLPQIVKVGDEKVEEDMVNLPVGIVGDPYKVTKIFTANTYDKVYIKPYAENSRNCLPDGLVFNEKTNEITGTPKEAGSYGVQIYCNNEYGSTNILSWVNIYKNDEKPTLTGELSGTAYVGSLYSASVKVGGYNQYFTVTLDGTEGVDYPKGMKTSSMGINACIHFTPTSDMGGKKYDFTLRVNNGLGEATKNCTITIAKGSCST